MKVSIAPSVVAMSRVSSIIGFPSSVDSPATDKGNYAPGFSSAFSRARDGASMRRQR